jgi:Tol biopolymer transport system component
VIARDADQQQGQFDVAPTGTLVYVPCTCDMRPAERIVGRVDVNGKTYSTGLPPATYEGVQISPDGKRLAVTTDDDDGTIWIYDIARGSDPRRFILEGHAHHPIWSADGRRVAYSGAAHGVNGIFVKVVDGIGTPERLTSAPSGFEQLPGAWSPDGKRIAFANVKAGIKDTITIFNVDGRHPEQMIAVPGSNVFDPAFSPDGQWIAYATEGQAGDRVLQIYVEPFPRTGAKHQLSRDGGEMPVWSRDGTRLFYRVPNFDGVVSVGINLNGFPDVTERVSVSIDGLAANATYDVSPGRDMLVVIERGSASAHRTSDRVALVLNWFRHDATGRISLNEGLR